MVKIMKINFDKILTALFIFTVITMVSYAVFTIIATR